MKTRVASLLLIAVLGQVLCSHAGTVLKRTLTYDSALEDQRIANAGLEQVQDRQFTGCTGWELGYEVDPDTQHAGRFSARCANTSAAEHRGLTFVVELNQTEPVPIIAECWSKAEQVSGGRDGNYSLYLDLEYMDGTPLWGQISPFQPGSHDWQKRTVTVVPAKPIRHVQVHAIFRRRSGTAWFDDLKLWELRLPGGARQFDAVPVETTESPGKQSMEGATRIFVRDVAGPSDFILLDQLLSDTDPPGLVSGRAVDKTLQLDVELALERRAGVERIDGIIRDLSGQDRAITVYLSARIGADGWRWHDDQRTSRIISGKGKYRNWIRAWAGANQMASQYPLACISTDARAEVVAAPLDVPRLWRFAYDADSRELYAAVDLGLTAATERFASSATFSLVRYPCEAAWGFRRALERYYELFPHCFTKRNQREGIWMPFTDIATVAGFADFGFQFQEGAPNVAFDEQHGIYSFVYVEPMSHWLSMPKGMDRTLERAIAYVRQRAGEGQAQSKATLSAAIETQDGDWSGNTLVAPWCDGALFQLNPSPNVDSASANGMTQFEHEWQRIENAFRNAGRQGGAWRPWKLGYEVVPGEGRKGSRSIRVRRRTDEAAGGATQHVVLNQTTAVPLVARVWTRAEDVSGEQDNDYSLYIDLVYADGSHGWGFAVPARTGTHDWQLLERTIQPAKPVRSLSYHLLLRGAHAGKAWFDDAALTQAGTDENLLKRGDFDERQTTDAAAPELDGTYIDSFEMGASVRNYRRAHFAKTETPLVFDSEGRVCQLGIFNTVEFAREVARRMWSQGKMMFANSTPHRFPWGAAYLDVMGTETNWARDGEYTPNPDAVMNYRRAICYQRPYLLLLNTVYDDFEPEWVELYFKRCTAYGIFPGFFSHNAADDPYWTRPELYERDRPLFLKYIPVIQALSAAGWEPVTHARSGNPSVYIERFGRPGGALFLTLFNDSHEPQTAAVSADLEKLGLDRLPARIAQPLTLAPEDVLVVLLRK